MQRVDVGTILQSTRSMLARVRSGSSTVLIVVGRVAYVAPTHASLAHISLRCAPRVWQALSTTGTTCDKRATLLVGRVQRVVAVIVRPSPPLPGIRYVLCDTDTCCRCNPSV